MSENKQNERTRKIDRWKVLTIIFAIVILLQIVLLVRGNVNAFDKKIVKFNDFEISEEQLQNLISHVEAGSIFTLCDIKEEKCITLKKAER